MAPLPKGPYIVEIEMLATIASQPLKHTWSANCAALGDPAPGTASTTISLATRSGGSKILSTAAQEWWTIFRDNFSNATTIISCNLFRYDGPALGNTFISAIAISPSAGSVSSAPVAGHETVWTFRTGIGGIMKIVAIEDIAAGKAQAPLVANPALGTYGQMAAYIMSSDGWLCGRGGSWPVAPMQTSMSYNETIEKRRFRPY